MPDNEITYEEDENGNIVRVQRTKGKPRDKYEVIREWNALMSQERSILDDLTSCRERIAALRPVKDALEASLEDLAKKAPDDMAAADGEEYDQDIVELAKKITKARKEKQQEK